MAIWVIADLHLSLGTPDKEMSLFGPQWQDHDKKIAAHWDAHVQKDDLVLIPGDISWAITLEQALADLLWIDQRPGTKVLIRGNHDYWWNSLEKMRKLPLTSIHFIQNNCYLWQDYAIAGARLWDYTFNFSPFVQFQDNPKEKKEKKEDPQEREKIYARELQRLELSLKSIPQTVHKRLCMLHYPPVDAQMDPSPASLLLEKYGVQACFFGHLHNIKKGALPYGTARGVRYMLTSCDYLNFQLVRV